jgi:hypothetical protein
MGRDKRQERKQETTQVEQPVQVETEPQEVMPQPKQKLELDDAKVAQLANRLCAAYESAAAASLSMQPVADAIKQTAGEVLTMGNQCDMRYVSGLLKRLMATIEPTSHRSQNHSDALSNLREAHMLLADAVGKLAIELGVSG